MKFSYRIQYVLITANSIFCCNALISIQRSRERCYTFTFAPYNAKLETLQVIVDGVYVGQNIATIYGDSPGLAPLSLVDVWYMELLNVNATILPHYKP